MGNEENKKETFEEHIEVSKQYIKDRLFGILNGTSFEKFSSANLFEIAKDLERVETLQDFIKSQDFQTFIKK